MNLQEAQECQKEYDKEYTTYPHGLEFLRHTALHIGMLLGQLSTVCERKEHGAKADESYMKQVIADLFVHVLQLANHYDVQLGETYLQRLEENKARINEIRGH